MDAAPVSNGLAGPDDFRAEQALLRRQLERHLNVHVAGLNQMNFAGHNDWRLPNVKELQSIVDYENTNPMCGCALQCRVQPRVHGPDL